MSTVKEVRLSYDVQHVSCIKYVFHLQYFQALMGLSQGENPVTRKIHGTVCMHGVTVSARRVLERCVPHGPSYVHFTFREHFQRDFKDFCQF